MTGRESHFIKLLRVPGGHDHAAIRRIRLQCIDGVPELVDAGIVEIGPLVAVNLAEIVFLGHLFLGFRV